MVTAVEVDAETESRLEELQTEIRIKTGRSVTQNELLKRLVTLAYESRGEVVDSFRESTVPLTKTEKAATQEGRVSSGVESDAGDVDELLYGQNKWIVSTVARVSSRSSSGSFIWITGQQAESQCTLPFSGSLY
jgi:hypothetical protein